MEIKLLFFIPLLLTKDVTNSQWDDYYEDESNQIQDDYSDDNYDYNDDYTKAAEQQDLAEGKKVYIPKITMDAKTFVFDEEKTIRLPCIVDKLPFEKTVDLLWYRVDNQNTNIAIGQKIYSPEYVERANITLDDRRSVLEISGAKKEDSGKYKCKVATATDTGRSEIIHTVIVESVPEINLLEVDAEIVEAKVGDNITLSCRAEGSPKPTIYWSKMKGKNMDDKSIVKDNKIVLNNATKKDSGNYVCTAENGSHKPVSKKVLVKIEDKLINDINPTIRKDSSQNKDQTMTSKKVNSEKSVHQRLKSSSPNFKSSLSIITYIFSVTASFMLV